MTDQQIQDRIIELACEYFSIGRKIPKLKAAAKAISDKLHNIIGTKRAVSLDEYRRSQADDERLRAEYIDANNAVSGSVNRQQICLRGISELVPALGVTFQMGAFRVRKYTENDQDRLQLWETPESAPVDSYA